MEAEPAEEPELFKPRGEEAALKTRMRQTHKRTWTHTRRDGQAKRGKRPRGEKEDDRIEMKLTNSSSRLSSAMVPSRLSPLRAMVK